MVLKNGSHDGDYRGQERSIIKGGGCDDCGNMVKSGGCGIKMNSSGCDTDTDYGGGFRSMVNNSGYGAGYNKGCISILDSRDCGFGCSGGCGSMINNMGLVLDLVKVV
ncbi:hypothetical protein V6N13_148275 [Hibiscus sabdariffa]|uniref:Uncharacterized protein n=1 Tax=Hibiscus sabdariffa TaxID=183260 RepID=A0ABR2TY37_9ROSI